MRIITRQLLELPIIEIVVVFTTQLSARSNEYQLCEIFLQSIGPTGIDNFRIYPAWNMYMFPVICTNLSNPVAWWNIIAHHDSIVNSDTVYKYQSFQELIADIPNLQILYAL